MDSIKRLTTEALQEIEDGDGYQALRTIIAAIEELAEEMAYPREYNRAYPDVPMGFEE